MVPVSLSVYKYPHPLVFRWIEKIVATMTSKETRVGHMFEIVSDGKMLALFAFEYFNKLTPITLMYCPV